MSMFQLTLNVFTYDHVYSPNKKTHSHNKPTKSTVCASLQPSL